MGTRARAMRAGGQARLTGRGFVALCVLVLALCVAHQFLMASERHAAVMAPLHERSGAVPAAVVAAPGVSSAHGAAAGQPTPAPMPPLMGDCPALQGILPFLLLLSLSLGLLALAAASPARRRGRGRPCSPRQRIPPLLPPPQRRALLQVFII